MRYVLLLALLLCASSVYGQDVDEGDRLLASADIGDSTRTPLVTSEQREPERKPRVSFNFDTTIRYPTPAFDDYWDSYANQPRVIYDYDYQGLHGVIYKQIKRQANRFYDSYINDFWDQTYLHPLDLNRQLREFNLNSSDWGNRYWEQRVNFWDHFPVEKGGARNQTIQIGNTYQILSLGPIHANNEGKIRFSDWGLSVDREVDDSDFDRDIVDQDPRTNRTPNQPRRIRINDYALGIRPPRGNIYTGDFLSVSGRMNVNVKINAFDRTNGTSIRGQLRVLIFPGYRCEPIAEISVRLQAKPFREQYSAQVVISLIKW